MNDFALSILVVCYRRVGTALKTLESLQVLRSNDVEIVVTDDCSPMDEVLQFRPYCDRIVTSSRNLGLGHNFNQGITACKGRYILMVQDDMLFIGNSADILDSIDVLHENSDIDIVRFYCTFLFAQSKCASRRVLKANGRGILVLEHHNEKFSLYSDTPHIRRNPISFGLTNWEYIEEKRMEYVEADYVRRFAANNMIACVLEGNSELFVHLGDENSNRQAAWDYRLARYARSTLLFLRINPKDTRISGLRKKFLQNLPHAKATFEEFNRDKN
jgi:glycosyltransferase involved in cell wall biosynthesis